MAFDIVKLIVFGANSGYFFYMGAAEQNLLYAGIGICLFFVMIGLVSFTTGYESLWTFLLTFCVTIPFNIKVTEILLFRIIRKEHPDWFNAIYEPDYTHELFQRGLSYLDGWWKIIAVLAGIVICTIILSVELFVSGMAARLIWAEQKNDTFDAIEATTTEEAVQNFKQKEIDEEKNNE